MSETTISQTQFSNEAAKSNWRALAGRHRLGATIVGLLLFVVLFWLPFGFKTTGLMEEWMIIHDWEVGGHSEQGQDVGLFVTTGTLTVRPMDTTWFILVHEAIPDSFLGFNLYTILTFFLKGLLLYAILRKLLPDNPLFAISVGVLFVIFPADDGLFIFRGMNIHTAVCLYLFAVYMLLSFYEKPHALKLVALWVCLIVSLFTYELAHPLIAFTPFILLWKEPRLTKRIVRTALAWWLAPLVAFLYAAFMFTRGESYQSWVLARSGLNNSGVLREIADSIWMAYRRHFVDGWTSALQQINLSTPLTLFAVAAGGIAAALIGIQTTRSAAPTSTRTGNRRYVELFLIGIVIIFLGYIVYMITPYRQLTWRVYYLSGIGGAICIGCLVYLVSRLFRRWQLAFTVIMTVMITLAAVHAFNQHQYYVGLSVQEQRLLRGVVGVVPQVKSPAALVVVDETGRYQSNWSLGASYLVENALRYIYDDYAVRAVLCYFNPQESAFGTLPELREQCAFSGDGIRRYEDGTLVETLEYSNVVVVRFSEDGAALLDSIPSAYLNPDGGAGYHPLAHVNLSAELPRRYETLFTISD